MDLLSSWEATKVSIKNTIGDSSFATWFSNISVAVTDNKLTLSTPDQFFKDWIIDHYLPLIKETLRSLGAGETEIEITIAQPALRTEQHPTEEAATPRQQPADAIIKTIRRDHLRSRLNFENFVIGSSNRFACAACHAVAENPAKSYNPLFIYGQSGMGKTHLMRAITNYITQKQPELDCVYITSEQFMTELIEAIGTNKTAQFKQKYRNTDVLLIDDIQFIAGKNSTQEEFFHTFNELHNAHKQIVITSDRPANEIIKMEDRLVTRFQWGLTVDIQPPDFETRIAILRKKIDVENVTVKIPDDVIYFIAEQIKTNIRELEGALIRVVAYSLLEEKPISLALTQVVLKDMVNETTKTISLEMVMQTVSDYFHINIEEMRSKKKSQNIVLPRQIAMHLARKLTKHSLPEVGKAFGGRDHTTVMHACKKIEQAVHTNKEISYSVDKLEQLLNH